MESILKLLIVLFLLYEVTFVLSEFTYEEGEWETMIVDLIARQVSKLPIEDFVDDPQLIQKVDRINKFSVYKKWKAGDEGKGSQQGRLDDDQDESIVYRRKNVDSRIPVIVLKSDQDHLKTFERKRTFVVLRQNPITNRTYFLSYVYLRFWTDGQESCLETYVNEKICLEFDTWDNDRGEIKTKEKYFGWTDCASTFLFSCRFEAPAKDEGNATNKSNVELVERGYRNTTLNYEGENATKLTFEPAPGLPFDDTIDIFWDLETNAGEGHYIRETIRHSSVFNKPESFIAQEGGGGPTGRSLGEGEESSDGKSLQEKLKEVKEKAKVTTQENTKKKSVLRKTLASRSEWFKRKNFLNNLIRKYAKEMGFREFYKIKNDSEKMERLLSHKDASEVLKELEEIGDKFEEGKVNLTIEIKEKGSKEGGQVTMLIKADEEAAQEEEVSESENEGEGQSLSSMFGKTLSGIALKSSGAGVSGRSVTQIDSKVAETIAKSVLFSATDTFEMAGWKLQGQNSWQYNDSLKYENEIFYGLGSCPFKAVNASNGNSNSSSDIVDLHLTIFRTYCLKEAREYLQYLIQEKYLVPANGKFTMPAHFLQSIKPKLRNNEFRKLCAALEISSFSSNYQEEIKHSWETLSSPEGTSRSVHTLTEFALVFLTQARKVADQHFIKLARSLVLTLKGVFTKLLQDYEIILNKCGDLKSDGESNDKKSEVSPCKWDLAVNYNDRLAIHSFMEFIQRGLAPLEQNRNILIDKVYQEFVERNSLSLENSLQFYE